MCVERGRIKIGKGKGRKGSEVKKEREGTGRGYTC